VGQVMKSSGGKANPQAVNDLLKSKLGIWVSHKLSNPHPEEPLKRRLEGWGRCHGLMVRDGACAPPHHEGRKTLRAMIAMTSWSSIIHDVWRCAAPLVRRRPESAAIDSIGKSAFGERGWDAAAISSKIFLLPKFATQSPRSDYWDAFAGVSRHWSRYHHRYRE
jgi:hypothetical protein